MLSIASITTNQGIHYFQSDNYSSQDIAQHQSAWYGKGATQLNLSGTVAHSHFTHLLNVRSPSGEPLPGRVMNAKHHRAGTDLTFSAPKSVSLAALWGGDTRLIQAHQIAVRETIDLIEQHSAQARLWQRQLGRQTEVSTGNLIVAQFHHTTSRATDPQLHSHNVLINATQVGEEHWKALWLKQVYANKKRYGAIYRQKLAQRCQAIGYQVQWQDQSLFEIQGYSHDQLAWFSKRRQAILAELDGRSNASSIEKARACLSTRPKKRQQLPLDILQNQWNQENQRFNLQVVHPTPEQSKATSFPSNFDSLQPLEIPIQGDLQQAIDSLAEAQYSTALTELQRAKRVIEVPDSSDRLGQIVQSYLKLTPAQQQKTLLLASNEQEQQMLTHQIRVGLKDIGALGPVVVGTQLVEKPLSLVAGMKPSAYEVGDVVVPLRSYPKQGLIRGLPYRVAGQDSNTLLLRSLDGVEHSVNPRRFRKAVYQQRPFEIALGDRLCLKQGDHSGLSSSGSVVQVVALHEGEALVRWKNGREKTIDLNQPHAFDYAWVDRLGQRQAAAHRVLAAIDSSLPLTETIARLPRVKQDLHLFVEAGDRTPQKQPIEPTLPTSTQTPEIPSLLIFNEQQYQEPSNPPSLTSNPDETQARAIAATAFQILTQVAQQHNATQAVVAHYLIRFDGHTLSVKDTSGRSVIQVHQDGTLVDQSLAIDSINFHRFQQLLSPDDASNIHRSQQELDL